MRRRDFLLLTACASVAPARAEDNPDIAQVRAGLRKAAEFYRGRCGRHGGYVYRYSGDLSLAEGEGKADAETIWVQPPGTPTVGEAFLDAYAATKDAFYLEAATDAGRALAKGQLQSGGWDYHVVFAPAARAQVAYQVDGGKVGKRKNRSTLDDDTTQAATRFLIRLDQALKGGGAEIREAARTALGWVLQRQSPNGGWYVNSDRFLDHAAYPVKKAGFPETWSRAWTKDFLGCYVLNDQSHATAMATLWLASQVYSEARYAAAALRGADFLLLAQMPDPQPAWAQQYDVQMHPAWSRKFEPPAVTGGESQGVLRMLMDAYRRTGDRKYLEPIPRALAYLKASRLPDGRLARFYELRTNKPLYFTRDYQLTYDDRDMPRHYSFKVASNLDRIEAEYQELSKLPPDRRQPSVKRKRSALASQARSVLAGMDSRGAWVTRGGTLDAHDLKPPSGVIESEVFARNVRLLCDYLTGE